MPILFSEEEKIFTIHTDASTYQMKVDHLGFLIHLYYGARTEGNMDFLLTYMDRGFSGNPYDLKLDRTYSLDALPQALATVIDLLPLSQTSACIRAVALDWAFPWMSLALLAVYGAIFYLLAHFALSRN